MRVCSIYPKEESEKAISNYTKQLNANQEKAGIKIVPLTYVAGTSKDLLSEIDALRDVMCRMYSAVHIQHEYNLLGGFGIPFFKLYKKLNKTDIKVYTTMHNVLSQKEKFSSGILKTFLRKKLYIYQNSAIRKSSNKVIVHAKFFKDILVKEYKFPEEKVIVLPQGIREDIKLMDKEKAKKELNLKGNIYLVIGSLIPDHGADVIIKQADKIKGTILVVANSKAINDRNDSRIKDWLNYNRNLVKERGLKNVRFDIKDLPYELWWKYFAAADVVLLPYKGGIGSGIFADCIATNKPMVGSDIKYFNEFARDWNFIKIARKEEDYPKMIEEIMKKENFQFEEYKKEYGLTNLANKYKEIYKWKKH